MIDSVGMAEPATGFAFNDEAIAARGLRRTYRGQAVVRGINLLVRRGEVFALLGPNGAGKTTTVEILEGFRRRDSGDVSVLGFDPARGERAFKARIGVVLQSTGLDPYLTVAETIVLLGAPYPRRLSVAHVIALVELEEKRDARVNTLSGGQRRRLDLAVALAGDPDLLFLDEPTTGFDPAARRHAWAVIRRLADLGKTIFLTTHYMEEAQSLANRVAVMVHGEIVAEGSPATLMGYGGRAVAISFRLPAGAEPPAAIAGRPRECDGALTLTTDDPTATLHALTCWALASGTRLEALHVSQPSLEDIYLALTQEAAIGEEARS